MIEATPPPLPVPPEIGSFRARLARASSGVRKQKFTLALVTPMFGGGFEAGRIDPMQPFRPSAIRGQLRFWWRATAGAACSTPEELFEREREIWGDTDRCSRVQIAVRNARPDQLACGWTPDHNGKPKAIAPDYVFFSYAEEMKNETAANAPKRLMRTGHFGLEVECRDLDPSQLKEVDAAFAAWLLFGGIGARTRRGCGTLYCEDAPESRPSDLLRSIRTLVTAPPGRQAPKWPTLAGASLFLGNAPGKPAQVWEKLIADYKKFRQARPPKPGEKFRGRSYWPEPEAIRNLTGRRLGRHTRFIPEETDFPRALLGLPVVTHFKDPSEPHDTILQLRQKLNRHASPLILKVLPLSATQAVPMALVLSTDIATRLNGKLELLAGKQPVGSGLETGFNSPLEIKPTGRAPSGKRKTLREHLIEHVGPEVRL